MIRAIPLSIVAAVGLAGSAHGYVRSRTDRNVPVYWPSGCLWIQPDAAGSIDLPITTVVDVVKRSVANWQNLTGACSYFKMQVDESAARETVVDRINIVKFRRPTAKWCRPAEGKNPEVCYAAQAAAITTVFYTSAPGKPTDGAIVDADIQMNEINYTFVVLPQGGAVRDNTSRADLENTLTHELGHLQGLDHTCWDHITPAPPPDHTDKPVPACEDLKDPGKVSPEQASKIINATMYNFALPGETGKRSPEEDDVAGICGVYPTAKDPKACERPDEPKGCAVGGRGGGGWLFGALLLGIALRRRRRRS